MNIEEFAKYLEPAFEYKRRRAEELASQAKESLARVRARVQERLKSGDLPEDLDVDCGMAKPFLGYIADPLELEHAPHWLFEHISLCHDCSGELERLEELKRVIIVSEMPVPYEELVAGASLGFAEKLYRLKAIGPEDITCEHAEPYYRNMALCNLEVPAEIYRHVMHCASCNRQVRQLHLDLAMAIPEAGTLEFEELRPEKRKQFIERALAQAQEQLRIGYFTEDEDIDIDCHMVRPFLAQAADPLGSVSLPRWFQEHLEYCQDCPGKLEQLKELSHVIAVADMPASVQKVIADIPPNIARQAKKLRAVPSARISCDLVSSYYDDMANCNLDVPAEIYRHARFCGACRDHVNQLRSELGVAIPQAGTPQFADLLAGKRVPQPEPVAAKVRFYTPSRASVFMQRHWRKLTITGAAAAVIIALLIIPPTQAMAVSFDQVCQAFAKIRFVCIIGPHEKVWYSKDPLTQIRVRNDGTYRRFTAASGEFVQYSPEGKLQRSKDYSGKDLQEMVATLDRDLDFRENLGLSKDVKVHWSLLRENVLLNGTTTDIYELTINIGKAEDEERKMFLVHVDKATGLPLQWEKYRQHWETRDWELISTVNFAYPQELPEEILNPKFAASSQKPL